MSKGGKRIDPDQLAFDFDRKINVYRVLKEEILEARPAPKSFESHEEACIQIAAALKKAIRASGLSREDVVDGINDYFGWSGNQKKRLSIHMLNHYLSKPVPYPIPAFYIYAIQHITKSLEPARDLAEAEDARVISGDEVRHMTMGKLDETILEMQRLKRELRGR